MQSAAVHSGGRLEGLGPAWTGYDAGVMALFCWLRSAVRCLPFVSLLWLGACGEEAAPGLAKVVHGPGAGEWVDPLPVDGGPATVWIFVTVDCPIANAYAPEIGAIGARCRELGVEVFVVHVDPGVTAAEATAHARAHGLDLPIILDGAHRLVGRAGATVTPEAAVFDAAGRLRYLGRIDDRAPALGARRAEPSHRELRAAFETLASGAGEVPANAPAVGCLIEELSR
jgi:hypothetical protein